MKPNDKELMERYIYQVIRRLPKAQKDEVRMELEELISDMYTDKGSMEEVLTQLGDPADFAKQYQNGQSCLIGPEYFETYLWFIKVVLICTAVSILAVSFIHAFSQASVFAPQNGATVLIRGIGEGLTDGISNMLISCISAFGAVTLIFAIMERRKIKVEMKKAEKWSVEKLEDQKKTADLRWTPGFLEPVPDKKAIISRGDSIVGIVFIVIFSVLLIFAPGFFSAFFNEQTVPVFNLDQWDRILPVFVFSLMAGLVDEILRLVTGCYCKLVMISNMICGAIQIVSSVVVLKILPIWNPDFTDEIQALLGNRAESAGKFFSLWNWEQVSNGLLVLIVLITLSEIGVTVYKTVCYGVPAKDR